MTKILPASPSKACVQEDEDEHSVEYSFATEYRGPPVTYSIPRAVPVDVDQLTQALVVSSDSIVNNLSLPVINPIVKKSDPPRKKLAGEFKLVCSTIGPSNSMNSDKLLPEVSDGIISSGSLGFSINHESSQELSGSSKDEDLNDDHEGRLISEHNLSEICPSVGGDCVDAAPSYVKSPIVTSRDPKSSNDLVIVLRKQEIRTNVKQGSCHRCLRRKRFMEKEVCIVCSATYCGNCVIRAMGSMPEGRKCITCIGYPIDESRRRLLGKSSRLLRRLLTDFEIKLVMQSEISCKANRLPPSLVYVNGKPLCPEEFFLLQTCPNPPKRLNPGRYWYDKMAGFWGKEGQKPCQIISAGLDVGGVITRKASNGNTNVVINRREITKPELWMLQWAGIRCEGSPYFWLGDDGILQEEGMNNDMGRLWDKNRIHLLCALFSLPIPPKIVDPLVKEVATGVVAEYFEREVLHKLLLVGSDKSGTSTIFKQARLVHNVQFTEDERKKIKLMVQSSLYSYIGLLLEGREQFEVENSLEIKENCADLPGEGKNVYSLSPRLKKFSDCLIQVIISGNLEVLFPATSCEYAPLLRELLKDEAIRATYNRMNELHMLPLVAKNFLERAAEISSIDYEPSDTDILYADGVTMSNGLASIEFSFPKPMQGSFTEPPDPKDLWLRKFQLTSVHSSILGEKCKWLEMFEDTDLILYCVSLTDYDHFCEDKLGAPTNKMLESKNLFEKIVAHPSFRHKNFLLLLTKFDLLEEKIEHSPLTQCEWFYDFDPVMGHHPKSDISVYTTPSLAKRAFHYIGRKFKTHFQSLTGRKLYVSMVSGLEPSSVAQALEYALEILKWEEDKPSFDAHDSSSCGIEASSSS